MADQRNDIAAYVDRLKGPDSDNAYHCLVEADESIIPALMDAFRVEQVPGIRAILVEIMWQRRSPQLISFLAQALNDPEPEVWKSALDGLVTLGGSETLCILESARMKWLEISPTKATQVEWIEEAIRQIQKGEQDSWQEGVL